MTVKERFLQYVAIDSGSAEGSETHPSTAKQWDMARLLEKQLQEIGASKVRVSPECYVYAEIPANAENQPAIGLIAHMDTVPCVPTGPVHARSIVYMGGDVEVGNGVVIRANQYDCLSRHIGHELIITDGTTLLGGDDKAGIAEIMTVCETLLAHPEIKHGKICIGFTPDEEIGSGADAFDVPGFGADFAYTVDGGTPGEFECENFNAFSAKVVIKGFSIHTGSAKNKMKNAARYAAEFAAMLPESETPEHTENREGFYHLENIQGDVNEAVLDYIVRDHDWTLFEKRKAFLRSVADYMNGKYGADTVALSMKDTYYNMKEKIDEHPQIVERIEAAMRTMGEEPVSLPIRGGTDGARLSYMGLPCPNLPTGAYNVHGYMEYVSVPEMEGITKMLVELVRAR